MGLQTTVVKSRGVYLNKDLLRNLIRLRLHLKNNSAISSAHHRRLYSSTAASRQLTSTKSITSGEKSIPSSDTRSHQPFVNTRSTNSSRYYSTSNNESSGNSTKYQNNNRREKQEQQQGKKKSETNMRVAASNALAAVFFTSLIIEESYFVNRGKGVLRYDVAQLPSNNPIEDARSEQIVAVPMETETGEPVNSDWLFFGVFDGHAGYNTSRKLEKELIGQVIGELTTVYKLNDETKMRRIPDSNAVDQAIRSGFLKLDDEIVNKAIEKLFNSATTKSAVSEFLMPALSGSCALLSFYDTHSRILKVAVTGDSRALLGSLSSDNNEWTVEQLSIDQTGSNPSEVSRMIREHPNEPDVIKRGRVLGSLEPTRSFGDARYKWTQKVQEQVYNQFFGRKSPPNLLSPPYVTAEPVITTTKIDPSKNQFLVMASDGLYEMLTNEEIVGLVVRWMENEKMVSYDSYDQNGGSFLKYLSFGSFGSSASSSSKINDAGGRKKLLPKVKDLTASPEASKQAFRRTTPAEESTYLLEDSNVSAHLIRNALSNGGSKEHSEMLASIPSPLSRRYRDDLTVTVVFFGNTDSSQQPLTQEANFESGTLEMNLRATNEKGGNVSPKPKL